MGDCCGCAGGHGSANAPGNELGLQYGLYQKIDKDNVQCLNEEGENSGRTIFKPWHERLCRERFVQSDADEELLFNIPFTGNVKLKGVIVVGEDGDSHPAKMRLFKNRPSMTFDDAQASADQEFGLAKDLDGTLEYATKVVTFSSVHHLTIHIPENFGADSTKIFYIGLKGEFSEANRIGVVNAVYEARPLKQDHKNPLEEKGFAQGPSF